MRPAHSTGQPMQSERILNQWSPGGTTVAYLMIGHPTVQVRSPTTFNRWFREREMDAVMIAVDLMPGAVPDFFRALRAQVSVGGVIVTVPHKLAAFHEMDRLSRRAERLGVVNVVQRLDDGTLLGDMVDGLGFTGALRRNGFSPRGKRGVLFGAGGVGSAIALALLDDGIGVLDIVDPDQARLNALYDRLDRPAGACFTESRRHVGDADLVINATPIGMNGDPRMPFNGEGLSSRIYVADVVTKPEVTPLLTLAQSLGCKIQTGSQMADAQFAPLALAMGITHPDLQTKILTETRKSEA